MLCGAAVTHQRLPWCCKPCNALPGASAPGREGRRLTRGLRASARPGGAGGERAHMRPLHAVDASGPAVRAVDLTEAALAAPDNPVHAESPAVTQHTGL